MLRAAVRRTLAAVPVPAATRELALAEARAMFGRGERIEMGALAEHLGVNRVTLYRWVGSREALLAELLWERMERGLRRADDRARRAGKHGTHRLSTVLLGVFAAAGTGSAERVFAQREGALAMRVMTSGVVHDRMIDWLATAIEEETDAGRIAPSHPARQVADIVIKSGEAVFWFGMASGRGVDRANVEVILAALCPPAG